MCVCVYIYMLKELSLYTVEQLNLMIIHFSMQMCLVKYEDDTSTFLEPFSDTVGVAAGAQL